MPEWQREGHHHGIHMAGASAEDVNGRLISNLRDLSHTMRMLYEGRASQKRVLTVLIESGPATQRELTECLGVRPGSASEILSKLEGAGWIVRTQNEDDRRTTDVSLTNIGRELAEEAMAQRRKRHEEMFSCLSEEEKQELLALLEKVRADWGKRYGEGGHGHGRDHSHHGPHDRRDCYDRHRCHGGHGHHGGHGNQDGPHRHGGD